MMILKDNPPWADRALWENWDLLEEFAEANDLPMPLQPRKGRKFEELGCGHYGCVLSTESPGIVFKLTSDTTETRFIEHAMSLGWPEGIVQYHGILELPFTFRRRSVSAIWREEAFDVGNLLHTSFRPEDAWETRERQRFGRRLAAFLVHAGRVRDALKRSRDRDRLWERAQELQNWAWGIVGIQEAERLERLDLYRGAERVASSWRACEIIAELMEHEHLSDSVGGALGFYLERNILLADVHMGNIGKVHRVEEWDGGRDERDIWVITDPGHTVIVEG
jgi:hypothetical protein